MEIWRTPHFTLTEFCPTSTGLANIPTPAEAKKLYYLATYLVEPIRRRYGVIVVTSGYRAPAVNQAVGGEPTSQHPQAEACDFSPVQADLAVVFHWIVTESKLVYGQCILERDPDDRVIHLSLPRPDKRNLIPMVLKGGIYHPYTGPDTIGLQPGGRP
jgi:hypothetical protein